MRYTIERDGHGRKDVSVNDAREIDSSRPMSQTWLLRWIRWTTGALLLLIIAIPILASAQERQLQFVTTVWPPFTNEPGQPRFALDLVGEALERVGVTAETVIVDEAKLTPSLLSGEFDGSAALWRGGKERERVLIYSQPYLENRLILVGRQGSNVSATSLADLAGKRIAVVAGYEYGKVVETTDGPIYVGSDSEEDSVARLLNGEVDYTLIDDLVIQYLISNHGEEARTRLAFGSAPLLTRSLHLAVRRSLPDAKLIISRFNAELRGMITDGSYHRLLRLDWIRADIDGDGRREYVPHVDRIGPHPPERSYELFTPASPTTGPGTTRRFYFDGNIYEGWSAVPAQHKALDFTIPEPLPEPPGRHTIPIFTFKF